MSVISKLTSSEKYEPVHTVDDYYDGPRLGIANFNGTPHVYQCQFSVSKDDWTDLFWLMPIGTDLFNLALERWNIFLRWYTEFKAGKVPLNTHPALPLDRQRYEELLALIGNQLLSKPDFSVIQKAHFKSTGIPFQMRVKWSEP